MRATTRLPRARIAAALLATILVLTACGDDGNDAGRAASGTTTTAESQGPGLGGVGRAVPSATSAAPKAPSGRSTTAQINAFVQAVLDNVDRYWTRTFAKAGLPPPRVRFDSIPPRRRVRTRCGAAADQNAAFYCSGDDTIYVGQTFALELYAGVAHGLPGQQVGIGHAGGDFAVAYVLAHEYAHNVQDELGIFSALPTNTAKPFELQADCLAGTWANSTYRQGLLEPDDLQEAVETALAVGDFEFGSPQHHGTPAERADALLVGFRSGRPAACAPFLAAGP